MQTIWAMIKQKIFIWQDGYDVPVNPLSGYRNRIHSKPALSITPKTDFKMSIDFLKKYKVEHDDRYSLD